MAGRPRSRSDDELLDAAACVLGRTGVAGLTFAGVAREAGIAPSSVHGRFGSKHNLLVALAARARPPQPRDDLPPREALVELLVRLAEPVAELGAFRAHFTFLQLDLDDPELGAHARRWTLDLRATIARLLAAAGYADAPTRAPAVHAAQQGALLLWALDGEGTAPDRVRDAVEAVL
ncbi:MAG TPA: TetR/AcrR family transcriptional regulator [Baekduia sp.]|uniref:TetR/AcrR family transcriptional regulator n=1 Tax=Baekduia sp. TaxID=2600305 RepID=UPI002BC95971|nr:TetR/AcrR family transcriptional regulator [Baekduia sp.]HMJ35668.1 TetR/AcrR family transcriptional regulator [Baekduia sp.]